MSSLEQLIADLEADLGARGAVVVAFSGGVDSGLVAALAYRALGAAANAVTVAAETLAGRELDAARRLAAEIGIRHQVLTHSELDNPEFVANPPHRCYVCQGMRMDLLWEYARRHQVECLCDGTNASDPGPDRPGLRAIEERRVFSPLLQRGVVKATARSVASVLGLTVWDRPSNACLSSRIPHGQLVTLTKLRRIDQAEEVLYREGFQVVRVRHRDEQARVEVGPGEIQELRRRWHRIAPRIAALGFDEVVLAGEGYRSGGANLPGGPADSEAPRSRIPV